MTWYDKVHEGIFDFQVEMRHYCVNNIEVLYRACLIYSEKFFHCSQLDRFVLFKMLFLPKDTLRRCINGAE